MFNLYHNMYSKYLALLSSQIIKWDLKINFQDLYYRGAKQINIPSVSSVLAKFQKHIIKRFLL